MKEMLKIMFMKAKDQKGVTAIEYGLIAALIAIGIIAGATLAGDQLAALFDRVATELTAALAG